MGLREDENHKIRNQHDYKYTALEIDERTEASQDEELLLPPRLYPKPQNRYVYGLAFLFNLITLFAVYLAASKGNKRSNLGIFPELEFETAIYTHLNYTQVKGQIDVDMKLVLDNTTGLVVIENPERYSLLPGLLWQGKRNAYGLSWAHQYHCLGILRNEFWALIREESALAGASLPKPPAPFTSSPLAHMAHCFDYLEKAIVCNMDMTIEPASDAGHHNLVIDGYGFPRTCVRKEPILKYLRRNQAQYGTPRASEAGHIALAANMD